MKRMMKKLRAARGLTLTELLATMLILALVAGGIAAGVSASLRVYKESTALSEVRSVSSILTQAIMDELRCARDVQADGSYTSAVYGPGTEIGTDGSGHVTAGGTALVGDGVYVNGRFSAAVDVDYADGVFQVELKILEAADSAELQTLEFSVRPLNS